MLRAATGLPSATGFSTVTATDPQTLATASSELERAVFLAVFNSRAQRLRRSQTLALFACKHALRGLLFFWPAYLGTLASLAGWISAWYLSVALPGVLVSLVIYVRALRADYRRYIAGRLIDKGQALRLAFGS